MPVWNKKGHQKRKGQICRSVGWSRLTRASVITGWKLVVESWWILGRVCEMLFRPHFGFTSFGRAVWKPTDGCWLSTGNLWIQRILNPQFSWGVLLFEVNGYDPDLNKSAITATTLHYKGFKVGNCFSSGLTLETPFWMVITLMNWGYKPFTTLHPT